MKNFSQFMLESKRISKDIYFNLTADFKSYRVCVDAVFTSRSLVEKIDTGETGRVSRRGSNHLICVTENGNMFKAWITDVKEVYEVGTCSYRKHAQQYSPGQPVKPFTGKVKIKSSYK